jgi:hypothetical protein
VEAKSFEFALEEGVSVYVSSKGVGALCAPFPLAE